MGNSPPPRRSPPPPPTGAYGPHACQADWMPWQTTDWTEWSGRPTGEIGGDRKGSADHRYGQNQHLRRIVKRNGYTGWGWGQRWTECVTQNNVHDVSIFRDLDYKIDYYFDVYLPDGRMQYCELRHKDYGWNYKYWNINNWRDYRDYCVMHPLYMPKVRQSASVWKQPRMFAGVENKVIDMKRYATSDLGNFAGNIRQMELPFGWYVRAYSGLNFNGVSEDYEGTRDLSGDPSFVRSFEIGPSRPAILSIADNHLNQVYCSLLLDDNYTHGDLNDGVFANTEKHKQFPFKYKTGVTQVWVPVGYQVTLYDGVKYDGQKQVIYGHNSYGWVQPHFVVRSIQIKLVLPLTYSKTFFTGFVGTLQAGDNVINPSRPVKSMLVPTGFEVSGRGFGLGRRALPAYSTVVNTGYNILELRVFYNVKSQYNMIDDLAVRTKTIYSKREFANDCKTECDNRHDCNAYYAIRNMRECPNPQANDGSLTGCKATCGFYEYQNDSIKTGENKSVEPYLFAGNVHVKQVWDT